MSTILLQNGKAFRICKASRGGCRWQIIFTTKAEDAFVQTGQIFCIQVSAISSLKEDVWMWVVLIYLGGCEL